jgi:hypothetical protein
MAIFLFNFKKQFAPAVERGEKTQTIRMNRKDGRRPVPGDTAKLYTGLRTSGVRLLRTQTVTECLSVRMDMGAGVVVLDGRALEVFEATQFAPADGFRSKTSMLEWFRDQYKTRHFEGFCALWTPEAETNNHG